MPLVRIVQGAKFDILAFGPGSKRPQVLEFLEELTGNDAGKLEALLIRTADHGAPVNKEKCRLLEDGIYEFKAGQARLTWFYDSGRIIICAHGFIKKKQRTNRSDIEKTKELKAKYFQEKAEG